MTNKEITTIRILKTTYRRLVDRFGYRVVFDGKFKSPAHMWDWLITRACINFVMVNGDYVEAVDWCREMGQWSPPELNHKGGRIAGVKGERRGDGGKSQNKDLWTTIALTKNTCCLLDHVIDLYHDCKPGKVRWSRQKVLTFLSRMNVRYDKSQAIV